MSYQTTNANKELKGIMDQYVDSYRRACEASRDRYIKTLKPGSPLPAEGQLYYDDDRAAFEKECEKLRGKAREITEEALSDLRKKSTEAPSTGAVNCLTLLRTRKNVTKEELDDLIAQYGDNPQAHRAIADIASEHGVRIADHPVDASIKDIVALDASINRAISVTQAPRYATDGFTAMIGVSVDNAFPAD